MVNLVFIFITVSLSYWLGYWVCRWTRPKVVGSLIINNTDDSIETQYVLVEFEDKLDCMEPGMLVSLRIRKQI